MWEGGGGGKWGGMNTHCQNNVTVVHSYNMMLFNSQIRISNLIQNLDSEPKIRISNLNQNPNQNHESECLNESLMIHFPITAAMAVLLAVDQIT